MPELALNLSRGCGNPTGFAQLQPGEAVVDLGCGGGIDVILAAHKVGPQGGVVGIDFTPQMIGRAKETVASAGLQDRNIELRLVEDMAETKLPDGSADVVISNCVINLCPDKDAVYREAFRLLRPGGRLAISDVVLTEDLATELRARLRSTWSGCLGGAIPEEKYLETVGQAGFGEIQVVACHPFSPDELQAMARCPGERFTPSPSNDDLAAVQGKVASIKFTALKPLASASEEVAPGYAATSSTMDQELSRPREQVASALAEAERRAAGAEARLTALQAEADELRRLVGRLEVERADLCRQLEIEHARAVKEPEAKAEGEPGEAAAAAAMTPSSVPNIIGSSGLYVRSRYTRTGEGPAEAPATEQPGTEAEGEPGEELAEEAAEEPGIEAAEPGEGPAEAPAAEQPEEEPAEEAAEEPGTEAEGEPGEEPVEEPEALAGEAELGVRQLAESVTATISITLPQVGSVRVQWDFRSVEEKENPMPKKATPKEAPKKNAAPKGKSTVAKTAKTAAKAKQK